MRGKKLLHWCSSLQKPQCPLPADDVTVALYFQAVALTATSFSAIKTTSAAIAFFQRNNMFNHPPTLSPLANFVREAVKRRIGTRHGKRKVPFKWRDVSAFPSVYAPLGSNPLHCQLVIAVMCDITFGAMCRFDDVAYFVRSDIKFVHNGNLVVSFRKRKSDHYKQGTSVAIASNIRGITFPVVLLHLLLDHVPFGIGKKIILHMFSKVLMATAFETWRVKLHRMVQVLHSNNTHVALTP
jgi:hypothetical protein